MPVTTIANVARPRIASHLAERGSATAPTISTTAARMFERFVK